MGILYQRSQSVAFVMGYDNIDSPDDFIYVANLKTSDIAVLNGPSAVIWEILEKPTSSESLIAEIKDIYMVPQETVAPSIINFLEEMKNRGLIQVNDVSQDSSTLLSAE